MGASSGIDPTRAGRSPTTRAGDLAERCFGAVARRQLLEQGDSSARIDHWRAIGRMFSRYPGVYAWGRRGLSESGQLAAGLLYAGKGSALGGLSALWWLGLLNDRPNLIHIDAPGFAGSRQDLLIRHPRQVRRRLHEGLPVVPLPQALLTAAPALSHNALRLVLARAGFDHTLSLPSVHSACGEGRPGSRAFRRALASHLPQLAKCANGFEREFVLLCERFRLPIPEPNPRVGRPRPDMLWRDRMLIVELDGKDAHTSPAQIAEDETRQAVLEAMGHTVIRFGWAEVMFEPQRVAGELRKRLR